LGDGGSTIAQPLLWFADMICALDLMREGRLSNAAMTPLKSVGRPTLLRVNHIEALHARAVKKSLT
jgi:hypothetical protein